MDDEEVTRDDDDKMKQKRSTKTKNTRKSKKNKIKNRYVQATCTLLACGNIFYQDFLCLSVVEAALSCICKRGGHASIGRLWPVIG